MANIIKIKRGSGVPASGVLAGHELGWDYTNDALYIGVEGASPIKIADAFAGYLSINKATGKLYATGAFEVDGTTQLDGAVTVNNTLSVTGSKTLTVGGLSYLNGGINVNTGKFTVASSTGNTYVSGTLTVGGSTTLGDSNGDVNTIRGIVTISDIDRLTTINGSLEVNQAVGIDGNLRVGISDTTKFSVNSTSGNIGTVGDLTVDGSTNLNGILDVDGGTTLRSTLGVLGNTILTGTLTANNDVFANANVTVGNASTDILTVNSTSTFNAPLTVSTGQLTSLDGGLDVNAKLTISATTGDIVTAGDITAVNAVINGDLTVHGTTTTVNSTTEYTLGTSSGLYDGSLITFPVSYTVGLIDVFLNGLKLLKSEYIATNGISITLVEPGIIGQSIQIVTYTQFNSNSFYTKTEIDNLLEGQGTGSNNTSGLSEQVIDSFPVSGYRSGEYLITCSTISGFMTLKLLVLHDDVETYNTIYGQLGTDLGTFDTSINGSNVEILFTPNVDGVEVKFNKTMI